MKSLTTTATLKLFQETWKVLSLDKKDEFIRFMLSDVDVGITTPIVLEKYQKYFDAFNKHFDVEHAEPDMKVDLESVIYKRNISFLIVKDGNADYTVNFLFTARYIYMYYEPHPRRPGVGMFQYARFKWEQMAELLKRLPLIDVEDDDPDLPDDYFYSQVVDLADKTGTTSNMYDLE